MTSALRAGVAYFAIVFSVGFIFGTIRVLVLVPRLGETGGVAVELPIMLSVSWFACGWLLERFSVRGRWGHRLAMGGVAFVLLMVAELGLSILAFGRSAAEHLGTYRSWGAALGLAGQVAFAAFPLARTGSPR
jgi:hypothetical protein